MPGIAGIISSRGIMSGAIERMAQGLTLDASWITGKYENAALNLAIGWADRAEDAQEQPVWNERRDICLLLSGETFLAPEERGLTGGGGPHAVLRLYETSGLSCLEKLNGAFAGLLIDLRRDCVTLFNDRYGLGRVHIHETPDGFYFATRARALLNLLPQLRRLDMRGVIEAATCGCVMQDRTLFSGVSILPGAACWTFRAGEPPRKARYFDRTSLLEQPPLDEAAFYDALKQTFIRILPKYMEASEPVAMSLTGGLDGRMIMAWARAEPGALPCYTFVGPYRDCADARIARRLASICGQPHQTIRVGDDFFSAFPALAERTILASDGAMDVTGAVELHVNEYARAIAPVRLTGNYGSEIVRGSVAFKPAKSPLTPEPFNADLAPLVAEARNTYVAERDASTVHFVAFKQVPWHHYARLSIELAVLKVRSPYLDNELVALMHRAPPNLLTSSEPSLRLIREGKEALARLPTDRGHVHGDDTLGRRLWERAIGLSVLAEYAYDYGMPQWLVRLDRAASFLHPERMFLGWHKFYHFRVWYRDRLAEYVRETLLDPRALGRDYLAPKKVERMVEEHMSGERNWTREISRMLSLELIHRSLLDR